MSEKQYVVVTPNEDVVGQGLLTLKEATAKTVGNQRHVHKLGPEVKEPDYGPLVEWVKENAICSCDANPCNLTDALKAAQIDSA